MWYFIDLALLSEGETGQLAYAFSSIMTKTLGLFVALIYIYI